MDNQQLQTWLNTFTVSARASAMPLLMGVLNITPDSFSDGGKFLDPQVALQHAQAMIDAGADIIDIGGESSRPGAQPITQAEELSRVIPVIELLRKYTSTSISIDTTKAEVMRAAVAAGANMLNDINGLQNQDSLKAARDLDVPICLMHMRGFPQTMQVDPRYQLSVIETINNFFANNINRCLQYGIRRENIILDPGFGFGKTIEHNLMLLKNIGDFSQHNLPIMLGVSRKSTLGALTNKPINERLIAGIAASIFVYLQRVSIFRTHDIDATKQSMQIINAIINV
ncbi:MAG: dihydropteroate synthase [Legionellales bacterium RIFCSPHIGHO2_12_FULL_42_9]|nr:MAG: dihydropteroate synthase [Legionellales bacterium RIFCSPHIGHO2_12_FULL_42_9]